MIGCWSYTVILTYIGLASAMTGISCSVLCATGVMSNFAIPVYCLLFSGLCDMFDGKIARTKKNRTEREKQFGIQIDSLCDVVCFGVQPAVLGFCLGGNRILGTVSMILMVLAGVVRLAYFDVIEMERRSDPENDDTSFTGLPITMSALIAPLAFCARGLLDANFPTFYQICMIITAILFVSKFNIRKPGTKGLIVLVVSGLAVGFAILILSKN
ncbi:MAG: CDP-alcohol phosphatidyltransferase family protein [Clostridia bacterium]|nr:CDP-alcohol phosphatidyltransferase family protein [Clostridia bacterium]MBR5977047.1 CDP-alcohol phosphatidyltransferase family protein [Clostridia bacterium]MBR6479664.1 CDP-alcohol phosphatidyltransferase family protein [Clostridia bacterium]MBR6512854.1 CDP-alcohol phosphatidyltransferase family protein [Clostridia bacterium]